MKRLLAAMRYWWRTVKRATRDTWTCLGRNKKQAITSPIGMSVATLLFGVYEGGVQALAKLEWYGFGVLASAAIFAFVFVILFLRTPAVMEEEAAAGAKEKESGLEASINQMRAELAAVHNLLKTNQDEQAAREKDHQGELEQVRHADLENNIKRHRIQQYIDEFKILEERAMGGEVIPAEELYGLETQANHFLQVNLRLLHSGFLARYGLNEGRRADTILSPKDVISRCQDRIAHLAKALSMFP